MNVRRIAITTVIIAAGLCVALLFVTTSWRDKRFNFYTHRLDAWVNGGGTVADVQSQVIENCGKLVISQAGIIEAARLATIDHDELDFRVDVCMKMTVNRVYKQPEFEKPEIVAMICDGSHELFRRLCQRSGLRTAQP